MEVFFWTSDVSRKVFILDSNVNSLLRKHFFEGLLEFDSTEEAVDTAAIANHLNGTHKGIK